MNFHQQSQAVTRKGMYERQMTVGSSIESVKRHGYTYALQGCCLAGKLHCDNMNLWASDSNLAWWALSGGTCHVPALRAHHAKLESEAHKFMFQQARTYFNLWISAESCEVYGTWDMARLRYLQLYRRTRTRFDMTNLRYHTICNRTTTR